MIYLIVPPIIIILAIAILIGFLARVLSSERKNPSLTKKKKTATAQKTKKNFFRKAKDKGNQSVYSVVDTTVQSSSAKITDTATYNHATATQGIVTGDDVEKVISLRKKSMVSDKIGDGEDRDGEELRLMKEIEKDPQNSERYEKLGDYYMEHEKFEDARECYKYVLRLNPRHKRAQVAMKNLDRVLQ